jgi:hypothetical protein
MVSRIRVSERVSEQEISGLSVLHGLGCLLNDGPDFRFSGARLLTKHQDGSQARILKLKSVTAQNNQLRYVNKNQMVCKY